MYAHCTCMSIHRPETLAISSSSMVEITEAQCLPDSSLNTVVHSNRWLVLDLARIAITFFSSHLFAASLYIVNITINLLEFLKRTAGAKGHFAEKLLQLVVNFTCSY